MAARGLLANPAMFAGFESTPVECVADWVCNQFFSFFSFFICLFLNILVDFCVYQRRTILPRKRFYFQIRFKEYESAEQCDNVN
jgi:hypothetical protein